MKEQFRFPVETVTLEFLFLPEFLLVRNILVFGCFAHICVDF